MNKQDFLNFLNTVQVNNKKISAVEEAYKCKFPDAVNALLSSCDKPLFIDDTRLLAYNEILDADEDLGTSFIKKQLFPLFDCGDNDFIVYHISKDSWSLYNIIDNCIFRETKSLDELL